MLTVNCTCSNELTNLMSRMRSSGRYVVQSTISLQVRVDFEFSFLWRAFHFFYTTQNNFNYIRCRILKLYNIVNANASMILGRKLNKKMNKKMLEQILAVLFLYLTTWEWQWKLHFCKVILMRVWGIIVEIFWSFL